MHPRLLPASLIGFWKLAVAVMALVLAPVFAHSQALVFTVDHNGTTTVFTNLDSAIANAQAGDAVTLPGGLITFSGTIRKGINLIGAGFFPDSTLATLPTTITNVVNIKNGASNIAVTGIIFQSSVTIDSCTNVYISRCKTGTTLSTTNTQNVVINGCVTGDVSISTSSSNVTVQNSLLYGSPYSVSGATTFYNNIIFKINPAPSTYGGNLFYNGSTYMSGCSFYNNIIYCNQAMYANGNNQYYNNIFTDTLYQGNGSFSNNKIKYSLSSLLQGTTINTTSFTSTDNFHLKSTGAAIGAGLSGTDCGIYGGSTPWKEGAVPYNPHIQSATVPTTTDQNGNLNVIFNIKAQDN